MVNVTVPIRRSFQVQAAERLIAARDGFHSIYQLQRTLVDWAGSVNFVAGSPSFAPPGFRVGPSQPTPIMATATYADRFLKNNAGHVRGAYEELVWRFSAGSFGGMKKMMRKGDSRAGQELQPKLGKGTATIRDRIRCSRKIEA